MSPKVGTILRGCLTSLLLIGVYKETGKWTTIAFFLLFAYVEVSYFNLTQAFTFLEAVKERLDP